MFQRALSIATSSVGPGHRLVSLVLVSYAAALEKSNRKVEARELKKRARAIQAMLPPWSLDHTVDVSELAAK